MRERYIERDVIEYRVARMTTAMATNATSNKKRTKK